MQKLSPEALESILRTLRLDGSEIESDKRVSARVGMHTQVDIEFPGEAGGQFQPFTAFLRDISAEGIGFVTNQHLPPGTPFIVLFGHDPAEMKRVQYSVAHCKMLFKGLYNVGARVEKPLEG